MSFYDNGINIIQLRKVTSVEDKKMIFTDRVMIIARQIVITRWR